MRTADFVSGLGIPGVQPCIKVAPMAYKVIEATATTPKRIEIEPGSRNWLCAKEVRAELPCTDRTLHRWRQQRRQGNKKVGIACHKGIREYEYPVDAINQYFADRFI
jgi:hypothetical protein